MIFKPSEQPTANSTFAPSGRRPPPNNFGNPKLRIFIKDFRLPSPQLQICSALLAFILHHSQSKIKSIT